ncbi:MAG: hypothetical protein K6G85_05230 [Eubacterium sp.]|nr:hypothetical protein [Eubacterium sp.]
MLKKILVCFMVAVIITATIGTECAQADAMSNPYGSCDGETHHDSAKFRKLIQVKKVGDNNYKVTAFFQWKVVPKQRKTDLISVDLTNYASSVSKVSCEYFYGNNGDKVVFGGIGGVQASEKKSVKCSVTTLKNGRKSIVGGVPLAGTLYDNHIVRLTFNIKLKKSFLEGIKSGKKKRMGFFLDYQHCTSKSINIVSGIYDIMSLATGLYAFSTGDSTPLAEGLVSTVNDIEDALKKYYSRMAPTSNWGYVYVDSKGKISNYSATF